MSKHSFSKKTAICLLMLGLVCMGGMAQAATFTDVTLGTAGPSGKDLGIFVVGPTQINASNSSTQFNTNMGLASGASTNFSGGGTLTGTLYADPNATVQSNLSSQFNVGGVVTQNMSQEVADVQLAAANAASLLPDFTFTTQPTSISADTTNPLNSQGGYNTVVSLDTNIAVTNPSQNLTINGTANDFFIINVDGNISVTNGQIALSGGITPDHVLFNILDAFDVSMSNSISVLSGTYLAPFLGQKITISPGTVNGAIIGYQIQTSSGPTVNGAPYTPPTPPTVPEPGMMLLLGSGLAAVAAAYRKFKS